MPLQTYISFIDMHLTYLPGKKWLIDPSLELAKFVIPLTKNMIA